MGAALGLIYLYYYKDNDTWLFFKDANTLADFALRDFIDYTRFMFFSESHYNIWNDLISNQPRSVFLFKVMSVLSLLGGKNYWISATYFSLISFLASWYLFQLIAKSYENSSLAASFAFLFFPSVAFWSSGLVKETLALSGLYLIAVTIVKILAKQHLKWFDYIFSIIGLWMAWNLKYYWTALFVAVAFTTLLVHLLKQKSDLINKFTITSWTILFTVLCLLATLFHPNFYLHRFLDVLIYNHDVFVRISDKGDMIEYFDLKPSWWSVLINSPLALISGMFRPFIWEASGLTQLIASIENLVITFLVISSLKRMGSARRNLLTVSVIVYSILLCVFLAISTPNFGTLSRYKVGFLPFLVFVLVYQNPLILFLKNRLAKIRSLD
jgi:hypothetical protein